jgi:cell division septation protein DedD
LELQLDLSGADMAKATVRQFRHDREEDRMTISAHDFEPPVPVPAKTRVSKRRATLVGGVVAVLGLAAVAVGGNADKRDVNVEVSRRAESSGRSSEEQAALPPQELVSTTSSSPSVSTTAPPSSTTTTSAAVSSSTTAPRATTTTIPARGAPSVTTHVIPDDHGVALPVGGVVFPQKAGWTEWDASSLGYRIRVWTEPTKPVAGQLTRFHVSVTGPAACCRAIIDTTGGSLPDGTAATGGEHSSCGAPAHDEPYTSAVIYPEPGLTRFLVRAGNCEWTRSGWITGWIDVNDPTS